MISGAPTVRQLVALVEIDLAPLVRASTLAAFGDELAQRRQRRAAIDERRRRDEQRAQQRAAADASAQNRRRAAAPALTRTRAGAQARR